MHYLQEQRQKEKESVGTEILAPWEMDSNHQSYQKETAASLGNQFPTPTRSKHWLGTHWVELVQSTEPMKGVSFMSH